MIFKRVTQQNWSSTTATGTLSGTEPYGYDAASQLTNDGSTTYGYDQNGNRTNSGYSTGTDNELMTDGTWNYTYDAVGNLVQKSTVSGTTTWTYGYDVANHLTSVVETTSGSTVLQVTYTYDVLGRRVSQSEWIGGTATVTRFAYNDQGNVWAELSSSNVVQTRFLYGDGTDQVLAREDGTTAYWYQTDTLGSVRDVFASMGSLASVSDHVNYSAYGVITLETSAASGGLLKYTAKPWDANTGLQYNNARYYNPATGQWISQDPLGLAAGSSNLYVYAGNDSTDATDPSGREIQVWRTSGHVSGSSRYHVAVFVINSDKGVNWRIEGRGPNANGAQALLDPTEWPELRQTGLINKNSTPYTSDIKTLNPQGALWKIKTNLSDTKEMELVDRVFSKLKQVPLYGPLFGPNSNTYAEQLLILVGKEAGFDVPDTLPGVTGWGRKIANYYYGVKWDQWGEDKKGVPVGWAEYSKMDSGNISPGPGGDLGRAISPFGSGGGIGGGGIGGGGIR